MLDYLLYAAWIACGVITYGLSVNYWVTKWNYNVPGILFGVAFGLMGPLGVAIMFMLTKDIPHGLRFK